MKVITAKVKINRTKTILELFNNFRTWGQLELILLFEIKLVWRWRKVPEFGVYARKFLYLILFILIGFKNIITHDKNFS